MCVVTGNTAFHSVGWHREALEIIELSLMNVSGVFDIPGVFNLSDPINATFCRREAPRRRLLLFKGRVFGVLHDAALVLSPRFFFF